MSKKYIKKTPREHVLLRPDTYVGDIEPTKEVMWVKLCFLLLLTPLLIASPFISINI